MILAIDPGTTESAYVLLDGDKIEDMGKLSNAGMRTQIVMCAIDSHIKYCVIEQIASYGMAVGEEVFATCVWSGRFIELFGEERSFLVPRQRVKLHFCGVARAKDANIRQAVIDRYGGSQAIKKGGPLYKVSGDIWSALALGLTFQDQERVR